MRKLVVFLMMCSCARATTAVSGNMQNLGTVNVTGGFMRFWLRGCAGNQPRVSGQGLIAPTLGGVFYFDFPANASGQVSGTLYSNRDSTGLLGGDIECGGSTTATWYGMQAFLGGKGGPEVAVYAKSGSTLDITSVTPITVNPVVTPPTGDSTYLRLDAGNSPVTGALTLDSTLVLNAFGGGGGVQLTNPAAGELLETEQNVGQVGSGNGFFVIIGSNGTTQTCTKLVSTISNATNGEIQLANCSNTIDATAALELVGANGIFASFNWNAPTNALKLNADGSTQFWTTNSLPASVNGSVIYCSNCKNPVDDAGTLGVCVAGGSGALARRENGHWICN